MITQNLPTLKIHQLTDEQYKRVKESEDYDPNALYLTPDEVIDLSKYVTKEESGAAINTALAHAKASGEFNGKDGKDGYTPIKGVDYFDGQPGKDGADGKDGEDYVLTNEDKSEIAEMAAALVDAVLLAIIGTGVVE